MKKLYQSILLFCFSALNSSILFSQSEMIPSTEDVPFSIDVHTALIIVACLLFIPIYSSGLNLLKAADLLLQKKKKLFSIIILFFIGKSLAAQTSTHSSWFDEKFFTILLIIIIFIEILIILLMNWQSNRFIKASLQEEKIDNLQQIPVTKQASWISVIWNKMNKFRPKESESELILEHSYDGIQELNNVIPPWFNAGFLATIVFAVIYLWRYHVSASAPLPLEEYKIEVQKAAIEQAKYLSKSGNQVDENNVTLLGDADIAEGKKIFVEKCSVCHEASAGSKPGGVGPNLTDAYWIHGGSISDIFKTIKYGYPDKGMISWKEMLSPKQINQIASFVKSVGGTNPPGAKEPQGELYQEVKTDSTSTK